MTEDLIAYRLEKLDGTVGTIDSKVDLALIEIEKLKVKAGFWGAIGAGLVLMVGGAAKALGLHF